MKYGLRIETKSEKMNAYTSTKTINALCLQLFSPIYKLLQSTCSVEWLFIFYCTSRNFSVNPSLEPTIRCVVWEPSGEEATDCTLYYIQNTKIFHLYSNNRLIIAWKKCVCEYKPSFTLPQWIIIIGLLIISPKMLKGH